jgi:hypothetical protein
MARAFKGQGSTCTVNGRTAVRTKRPGSASAKRNAQAMRSADLRDTVLRMYLERVSQPDIGRALNLSQGRISQILKEAWEEHQPDRMQTVEHARQMALMECSLHAAPWMKRSLSPHGRRIARVGAHVLEGARTRTRTRTCA